MSIFRYFILISIIILFTVNSYSEEKLCVDRASSNSIKLSEIKNLDVIIENKRKWIKYIISSQQSSNGLIDPKYKKKFNAIVSIKTHDNAECLFKSKIRINGDRTDHIRINLEENIFIASIDVELKEGNIENFTKFKLFLENTKKSREAIIFSSIIENLGFIKRREKIIDASILGINEKFLLQEKYSKENLEFNKLREGPIIVANEEEIWRDGKVNCYTYMLKVSNENWLERDYDNYQMSLDSLNELNKVYFHYHQNQLNCEDKYLNFNKVNKKFNTDLLKIYDAINVSFGAEHGLFPNNRKYFVDYLSNKIHPLSYDEMPTFKINETENDFKIRLNEANLFIENNLINSAIIKIKNLEVDNIIESAHSKGVILKKTEIKKILESGIDNLNYFKNIKFGKTNNNNFLDKIFNQQNEIVFYDELNRQYLICDELKKCNFFSDINKTKEILSGKRNIKNKKKIKYIGKYQDYISDNFSTLKDPFIRKKLGKIKLKYTEGVEIDFDNKDKEIQIYQNTANDKVIFYDSKISDYKITFRSSSNQKDTFKKVNNLTGCLTFYNIIFNKTKIFSKKGYCEDQINIINSTGNIDEIFIENSKSDGLDIDMSKLNINVVTIYNSKNDCLDFSWGDYHINNLEVNNCGDKGVSVGENSKLHVKYLKSKNTNISLAAKDDSKVTIDKKISKKSKYCLSLYNKKQEFRGAEVSIQKFSCENYNKNKIYVDNKSILNISKNL